MQRRLLTIMSAAILTVGLSACGSDSDNSGDADVPAGGQTDLDAAITIESFTFTSDPVKAGATITIVNDDTTTHSIESDAPEEFATEGTIAAGESADMLVPDEPGSYPFHCGIHSTMTDTLVVE